MFSLPFQVEKLILLDIIFFLFGGRNMGKIDVVVSNATANPSVDTILQTKELALYKLWEINVKTSILLLQVNRFLL